MGQNLLGKTIKSRTDHLKEPFLTSEKKWNIENMNVRIGLIWQCVLSTRNDELEVPGFTADEISDMIDFICVT